MHPFFLSLFFSPFQAPVVLQVDSEEVLPAVHHRWVTTRSLAGQALEASLWPNCVTYRAGAFVCLISIIELDSHTENMKSNHDYHCNQYFLLFTVFIFQII